jgi:hypothetical protein
MKVYFRDIDLILVIEAETPAEAYALKEWSKHNVSKDTPQLEVSWNPENFKQN